MSIKKEWDSIIEKKLKPGTSLGDLAKEYPSGIALPPNITVEEITSTSSVPKEQSGWINMALISEDTSQEKNRVALQALRNGVDGLSFTVGDQDDISIMLKDIATEYLQIRIVTESHQVDRIKQEIKSGGYQNITVSSKEINLSANGDAKEIANVLSSIDGTSSTDIIVTLGKDIIYEISRLRALREIVKDFSTTILARYDVEGTNDLGDYDLIEKTYKVLSAVLGGADIILTDYTDNEDSRLAVNIHHILDHEVGLKHVIDPAHGAYYIEKLTADIIAKVNDGANK